MPLGAGCTNINWFKKKKQPKSACSTLLEFKTSLPPLKYNKTVWHILLGAQGTERNQIREQ